MDRTPRQLLDEYRRQYKTDAGLADKSLLTALRQELATRLHSSFLEFEDVHVAADLSLYFGENRDTLVQVLQRYLGQTLTDDERARTWWKLVDNLALLERSAEAIHAQREFFAWASRTLTPDELIWVMYDSTQAFCWVAEGHGEKWLEIFRDRFARLHATVENRRARLIYLETASVVLDKMGQPTQMLQVGDRVQELSQEDSTWNRALEARLTASQIQIRARHALQEFKELRSVAEVATGLLEERLAEEDERRKLWVQYNNVGSTLYLLHQYDLAVPLLRRAVELGSFVEHTFLWLAASLWQLDGEKGEVLALLRKGRERAIGNAGATSLGYDRWRQLPEFKDVSDAPEFLEAVS